MSDELMDDEERYSTASTARRFWSGMCLEGIRGREGWIKYLAHLERSFSYTNTTGLMVGDIWGRIKRVRRLEDESDLVHFERATWCIRIGHYALGNYKKKFKSDERKI